MFFDSLSQAATLFFKSWSLMGLAFLLIFYGLSEWMLKRATPDSQESKGAGPGCLISLLSLLIQSLGLAFLLMLLFPLLSGHQSQLSWSIVEPMGFIALRAALMITFILSLITFIPWIGSLLANSPSLESFLASSLCYYFILPYYLELYFGKIDSELSLKPYLVLALPFLGLAFLIRILSACLKKVPGILFIELSFSWYLFLALVKRLSLSGYLF
ncbi:MAG: hypothetical protein KDK66_03325 [Deltaproteobacteria bacterium]|nr:hypothetical protein [Deltaproteobacteria bacterium]